MSTPAIQQYVLYLSAEGNSVEIKTFNDSAAIPEQVEAVACRTHEEVLAFLQRINGSQAKNLLSFYHHNNTCYDRHVGTWPKGVAHPCPIEKQIGFVQYKIGEHVHGARHEPRSLCVIQ